MILDLEQEPFAASGGIDGRAARRAMGKPDIQFWELFLRETLQNSWDAKLRTATSISFAIDAVTFSQQQAEILAELFDRVPPSLVGLAERLRTQPVTALLVTDQGTRGLGGVTRADTAAEPNMPREYVDFLRNVGRASSKTLGGGTYGFGKGVLYDASELDTCIVYSQISVEGRIENRLVASCVGEQFEQAGRRFTGRSWWGISADDGVVDPLTGVDARLMAESLGLARMRGTDTGTAVAVLQPRLRDEETTQSVVEELAAAARHWAWPHMVDLGTGPSINFSFTVDGTRVDVLDPAEDPVLQHFVRAYEKASSALTESKQIEEQWPWTVKHIGGLRPIKDFGVMAYRKYAIDERLTDSSLTRHIALMRSPRLVVKYLQVAEDPAGQAIAGVFVVNAEANSDFARSEPVAHDDWVPDGGRSNPVKIALNNITAEFRNATLTKPLGVGNEHASGVAQLSRMLGSVLSGVHGPGGELQKKAARPNGAGGGGKSGLSIQLTPDPKLLIINGVIFSDFYFKVNLGSEVVAADYLLAGSARVVLDGGAVENPTEVPAGEESPEVVGWFSDGTLVSKTNSVSAHLLVGESVLRIRQPSGTAITAIIESSTRS